MSGQDRGIPASGSEAVAVLEELRRGASSPWPTAISRILVEDFASSRRALELAERVDDTEIVVRALASLGFAESLRGMSEGVEKLTRALELAGRAGLPERLGERLTASLSRSCIPVHTRPRTSTSMQASGIAASTGSSSSVSISSRIGLDRSSIRGGGQTRPPPPRPSSAFRGRRRCLAPIAQVVSGSFERGGEIPASRRR